MSYLSLVIYNRELVVINDMDTFTHYFCYAKKQKQGPVVNDRAKPVVEEAEEITLPTIEYVGIDTTTPDDDVL